nr:uncharacterized protein LOC113689905 [Ipomoea trifida]
MEIPEKILQFKFYILFSAVFSLITLSLIYLAPSFLDILNYFWPLFLSTALFLVAVVLFGRTSPPPPELSGEGILDYVAGKHQVGELQPQPI